MELDTDKHYMKQAITLAKKGLGFVGTNPVVGCVIVKKGKVIGRGYYKKFGGPHAEVNALALRSKEQKAKNFFRGSTVYVTLEPHSFHGKTPPCTDALIEAGVKKVIIGVKDPNPKVAGSGVGKLKRAGIEVEVGILQKECEEINQPFIKWVTTKKPYVVMKCAVTLDGSLSLNKATSSQLSSPESITMVHELRHMYDAISVGVETMIIDNPGLTTRRKKGKNSNPVRVIFDTRLRTPENSKMFALPGKTIIFTGPKVDKKKKEVIESSYSNVEVVSVRLGPICHFDRAQGRVEKSLAKRDFSTLLPVSPTARQGGCSAWDGKNKSVSLKAALSWLGQHDITSVLIEGGAVLANAFIEQDLVDKYIIIFTPHVCKDSKAPRLNLKNLNKNFDHGSWEKVGEDAWLVASR